MKTKNLFFSLGAISAAAVTLIAVNSLKALSPLRFDPIAAFAASVVAFSGFLWFRKASSKHGG